MADDNWGATVDMGDVGYTAFSDESPAGYSWFEWEIYEGGDKDITVLRPWVLNQKPAHISALADQFRNARTLLVELENAVRLHSQKLFNETWTNSDARQSFMQRGPGRVLAYLQDWQTQVEINETTLRALLEPIRSSQTEMEQLWRDYERDVASAKDPDTIGFLEGIDAVNPNWHDYINPLSFLNDSAEIDQFLLQRVQATKEKYNKLAQQLADRLMVAYREQFFRITNGVGATYEPPNVTMVPPGVKLPLGVPGAPSGFAGNVPSVPNVTAPPPPPALPPAQLTTVVPPAPPALPPMPVPPAAPPVPAGLNAVPPAPPAIPPPPAPGNLPGNLPAGPPGVGLAPAPGALPAGLGSLNPGALPGTGKLPSGAPGLGGLTPPGFGKGLSNGVLRNPGATPGLGMVPPPGAGAARRRGPSGSTLRSPAANYTATGMPGGAGGPGTPGVLPPPAGAQARRRGTPGMPGAPGTGVTGVPEAFSRGTMPPPVSPVLGRPAARRRPGTPAMPPAGMRGAFAAPDATPPVLDATTARPAGMTLPPGGIPPQRPRRDRRATGSPAGAPGVPGTPMMPGGFPPGRRRAGRDGQQTNPNLVGNPDWLAETGPEESASTAPVLRNQVTASPDTGITPNPMLPVQPGATNPVLGRSREAVRRAMAENRTRPGTRPSQDEVELARRVLEAAGEQSAAREGEEAFTVQTPGGPVVGNAGPARPEPAPAPRPTVGNT
jgi:hypothetical protein